MSDSSVVIAGEKKRATPSADDVEYLLENDVIDIDTLKQFTIPKKKSHKHDIFTRVEMSSPEARELIRIVHQSFKDRESIDCMVYSRPRIINNTNLLDKFAERRKQMKHDGYSDKELQEMFAFLYYDDDMKAVKVCSEGVSTNNTDITCLGDPRMGTYLSKHADIVSPKPFKNKMFGTLLILKVIKGRMKLMSECWSGATLDPSPNFDCHVLKSSNLDVSSNSLQHVFECTQLYLYEYTEDSDLSHYPGQILPHALLNFRYERSGKNSSLLGGLSMKQNKMDRKSGAHGSEKKASKLQSSAGNSSKDGEPHAASKQAMMPFNEYQLWSGNLFISEMPLGFFLLHSGCLLIDATLLGSDIQIKEKVSLEYLKTTILKDSPLLDRKKENVFGNTCIIAATLHPSFPNANFNSFHEHLMQTSMVGYVVLLDCTEIFIVPSEALKDCVGWSHTVDKQVLCCLFVSKNSGPSKLHGYVERKLALTLSRKEFVYNDDRNQKAYSAFCEAPASPEQEQTSVNVRDPRLRHKTKSSKTELESGSKQSSIVGTSRLLSLFEHMSEVQDKTTVDAARSGHGGKTNFAPVVQARHDVGSSAQQQQPSLRVDMKLGEPIDAVGRFSQVSDAKLDTVSMVSTVTISNSAAPSGSLDSSQTVPLKLSSFKIPDTIYATAIADPKVSQLLEDLKSKNIIGLGLSSQPEAATKSKGDVPGGVSLPKMENPEPKRLKIDPRLEKMSKVSIDNEMISSNRPATQVAEPQNVLFGPETNRVDAFSRPEVPHADEQYNAVHPAQAGPYSPVEGGTGSGAPNSPQFSDPRRRYGSFLPDPKTFQKTFMDNQHPAPQSPYPNKPDPRMNRSRYPHQHSNR